MFGCQQLGTAAANEKEPNQFDAWFRNGMGYRGRSAIQANGDEYERYCASPPVLFYDRDPYKWWLEPDQKRDFPTLSQIAIDILSIPAMSDEPDRISVENNMKQ